MSEDKANYHPLFVTAVLISAGLISPSNSVDERTFKTPFEMLSFMVIAIFFGVLAFSIWKLAEYFGLVKTTSQNQHD